MAPLRDRIFFAIAVVLIAVPLCHVKADLVVVRADRKIDLQSHIVRVSVSLKLENQGSEPVDTVAFALTNDQASHLAFTAAGLIEGKAKSRVTTELTVNPPVAATSVPPTPGLPDAVRSASNVSLVLVRLPKPLPPAKGGSAASAVVEAYFVLLDSVHPFPAEIGLADRQLAKFFDSHVVLSSYPVRSQTLAIQLPGPNIESFTDREPSKQGGNGVLQFGPYEDVPALEASPLVLHYEAQRPFSVAVTAEREIEVSHWGNVFVTDNYVMTNAGARHKGMFSRLDFLTRPQQYGVAALRGLVAVLPAHAHTVFYRDEIGNISTSNLRYGKRRAELELFPRYPLLGGWSILFTLGYSVPLGDLVSVRPDGTRVLNATFGSPFHDTVIRDLTVTVILPEGSYSLAATTPVPASQSLETSFRNLDTVGRPTIVLKANNIAPEVGVQHFQVSYKFSPIALLSEPLLLIASFFFLFLLFIIYANSDLTISHVSQSHVLRIQREELLHALQTLHNLVTARGAAIERLDASLQTLGRTGDVAAAKATRAQAEAELKAADEELKAAVLSRVGTLTRAPNLLKAVDAIVVLDRERAERGLTKHAVSVEAYEKSLSAKDIDARITPHQQKLVALKGEIKQLLITLEEIS